jgi:catechol 2,3-dioxygenase
MTEVLVSQLAHVQIFSPRPAETVEWFRTVLGLEQSGQEGQSAYLRGWAEWFQHSVEVTEGPEPGLGHIGWRAQGPGDPDTVARNLPEGQWSDGGFGYGKTYQFRGPGGHLNELFWEVERYQAPPELATDQPDRPQALKPRGIAARYIDHVTIGTDDLLRDVNFYKDALKLRHTASIEAEPGFKVFATLTSHVTHEMGLVPDFSGIRGRVNHLAFGLDQRSDVHTAAQVLMGHDTPIEFGPGIHGIDEIVYLYVREPGGVRVEINSGGWQNYMPDFEPRHHLPDQGPTSYFRNLVMPDSMMDSFPPLEVSRDTFSGIGQFADEPGN